MRVSNNAVYDTFLKYDRAGQKDIARYTQEISSGKKLLLPSDNFASVAKSLKLKESNKDIDNYLTNITEIKNRQIAAQTAITNIADAATEARVEIVRLLNTGVLDQEDAEIVNHYLQELKEYMIDQANTKIGDSYLFAGTKTDTKPFEVINKELVYSGNDGEREVNISKNFSANSTFNGNKLGLEEIVKVIEDIDTAITIDQDLSSVSEDSLKKLDEGISKLLQQRSFIGSQERVVDSFKMQHDSFKTVYNNFISSLEDADISEAVAGLERAKVAYEASMAVFTQNKDLNLLKYLQS